jgi:signal transduction histidine kinase
MDLNLESSSADTHLPDSARRPVLLPALLAGGCTLALTLALWGRPLRQCHFPLTTACGLANLVSAGAAFLRAREMPGEARGWRLLAASLALLSVANLGVAFAYRFPLLLPDQTLGPVLLGVLSQVLASAALVLLPWRSGRRRRWIRGILGNALFVGSILLILWTVTDWSASFRSHNVVNLALLAACGRLALMGGITLVLLEQDPRRIHGLLGFVLLNVFLGAAYVALLQHLLVRGESWALPLASVYSFAPLILGLAAWSRAPLECPGAPPASTRIWELLPYAGCTLAAGAILLRYLSAGSLARFPQVGFVTLTWLLLLRQFILLRDLRDQNQSLEQRVRERTRDLEAMQDVVLRTERLNTLSILGAGIAHDLNNFLGVIHTSAQLLQEPEADGPARRERLLARILASSGRAAALTGRLLGFARRAPETPRVLDLAQELAQLEDLLRLLLPRNVQLRLERAPGSCPVRTCKSSLEQILVNLVGNARDAMPGGGTVTLRLERGSGPDGARVRLQVEDDGPGLPPEVHEHLFEPFVTTKGEGKGTGLGLATVKNLVQGDGGTVQVDSRPGAGCRFLIDYPLAGSFAATP